MVNEDRYKIIQAINFKLDYFTTKMEEGWIEVIRKGEIEQRISEKLVPSICITATGWANGTTYISPDKKKYVKYLKTGFLYFFSLTKKNFNHFIFYFFCKFINTIFFFYQAI